MKPKRQNQLPEAWAKLRWVFLFCIAGAFFAILAAVRGLQITADPYIDARPYFDPLFRFHIVFACSLGLLSLAVFVACELWVPRILKKRALNTTPAPAPATPPDIHTSASY